MNQGKHADIPAKEPQGLPETCKLFFDKGEDKGLFGMEAKTSERRTTTGQTLLLQDSCIANLEVVERPSPLVNCTYNFDTTAQPQAHVVQASILRSCPNVDDITKSSEPNRYSPPAACRPALSLSSQAKAKHLPRSQASDITRM
ncbi:hypothetical protein QR685DRAFT_449743 [Neurospora intermedia]|uniref:Uncharacterized protein n=1 Tax=Neurospora intermedia TaxID=5142 RepID=A0ABR3D3I7_NEUIN